MAYTKQTWTTGETITKSKLEHIEDGIADLDSTVSDIDFFNPGTQIPNYADLNDYLTPGKYYSQDSSATGTMENVPRTGSGFTLFVIKSNSSSTNSFQILLRTTTGTSTIMYIRTYVSNTWQSWYLVSVSEV